MIAKLERKRNTYDVENDVIGNENNHANNALLLNYSTQSRVESTTACDIGSNANEN